MKRLISHADFLVAALWLAADVFVLVPVASAQAVTPLHRATP